MIQQILSFLWILGQVVCSPLQTNSYITLRTTVSSSPANFPVYKQLILEEWSPDAVPVMLQSWSPNCSLPDLSTEAWREGLLRPSYPYGDDVWFLCRTVPVNTSVNAPTAPLAIMNLKESGELITYATDAQSYPAASSSNLVYAYQDSLQNLNVFYMLGGGTASAAGTPPRAPQARIRVDTGPGTPIDTQGPLATLTNGMNTAGLTIMTDSVFMPISIPNGTSQPIFSIYLVGNDNQMPITNRNRISVVVANLPVMLSTWTFPFVDVLWYTAFNRIPYLARTNYSNPDASTQTYTFTQFPSSGTSGSLGGATWRVCSARFEGNYASTGETIYITNGTTIFKNTVIGLATQNAYQQVLRAPPGWKYMDIHPRFVFVPSPSATPTATSTATATSSASASSSATATSSATESALATATATGTETATASPTATASASATASSSATTTATETATATATLGSSASSTPSSTPSPAPSNGTMPVPYNAPVANSMSPGQITGVSLGLIASAFVVGFLGIRYVAPLQNLYVRQFGKSSKGIRRTGSSRRPISADAPITISYNPQVLAVQRVEQLKEFMKKTAMQETNQMPSSTAEKNKKEFRPTQVE